MPAPSQAIEEALRRAPKAILATIGPDGRPNLVPIVFVVLSDGRLVSAVDQKPKRTRRLQRLENIRSDPRITLLVDHYADDWNDLWWLRIDATAEVHDSAPPDARRLLAEKYSQYGDDPPSGPWIVMEPVGFRTWSADPGGSESPRL